MTHRRTSGILLHPTSLPGPFGIGELGPQAIRFLDFLQAARQQWWQVLPLGPTGYGDSPYQSFSAFAGNPMLISIDQLLAQGLLSETDIDPPPQSSSHAVNFGAVIPYKTTILDRSFVRFKSGHQPQHFAAFDAFCHANSSWLDDYALFSAIKEAHGGAVWTDWDADIASRQPHAVERWKQDLADSVHRHKYLQYLFHTQWATVREEAHERGISLIGDVPIFVAHDSADVWARPDMFYLDDAGNPTVVAGVPPDYFSATGQLWGNPLYRWDRLKQEGYDWWIRRIKHALRSVDLIRLDHFRGFEGYWEVPASEDTAVNGRWMPGPGADLFKHLQMAFGQEELPLIAEDLGVITDDVIALREAFNLPGMKILQFSFSGGIAQMEAPYRYPRHCVVYTGTHDNDTSLGWLHNSSQPEERELALKYLGTDGSEFHWDFIRLALSSVANTAVVPLQDVLGLGSETRMNFPSRAEGNWRWRFDAEQLTPHITEKLAEMTRIYGRSNGVL
jgi:4-alpha-glucanotransferase